MFAGVHDVVLLDVDVVQIPLENGCAVVAAMFKCGYGLNPAFKVVLHILLRKTVQAPRFRAQLAQFLQ